MEIKISKRLEWIRPYIEHFYENKKIKLKKPKKIKSYKVAKNRKNNVGSLGTCYYGVGVIVIFTHIPYQLSKKYILKTLAHELAHLKHHEHTNKHLLLTNIIFDMFVAFHDNYEKGE